ncbi:GLYCOSYLTRANSFERASE [Salix viminalis]|uniref:GLYCOSYLTRANSFERASE n=1 Tax=Salix viminalis TaxID=40686 RepID=A0A9Q0U0M3_SALVM|nr:GLYCOSYLTRANSFERASE [Salix viminalis]
MHQYLSHVFSSVSRDLSFIDHTSDLGWKEPQRIQPIVVDPGIYLARRSQIFHATEKRSTPDGFKVFTGSPWKAISTLSFAMHQSLRTQHLNSDLSFRRMTPVLDKVDEKILRRGHNRAAPGACQVLRLRNSRKPLQTFLMNGSHRRISANEKCIYKRSIYRATPLAGYDIVHGSGRVEGKQVNSLGGFSEWCTVMGADKRCESIRGPPSLRCPHYALECPFCSFSTIQKL